MSKARLYTSLPLSAFAAALLIGAAPAAWAQCKAGAGGGMTTAQQQGTPAQQEGAATGTMTGQGDTAMAGSSDIKTGQGGVTVDESGAAKVQPGTGGSGSTTGQAAAVDSPKIEGAGEERVKTMLQDEGYTDVSAIYSCGSYYEAKAMKGGKETNLVIDTQTGRITPQ